MLGSCQSQIALSYVMLQIEALTFRTMEGGDKGRSALGTDWRAGRNFHAMIPRILHEASGTLQISDQCIALSLAGSTLKGAVLDTQAPIRIA